MSALVLRRLPSGAWALVAVPEAQPVATVRRPVPREEARRLPFLVPLPAAGGRS
ncbi:MAG: hypothetical protein RBU36_17900 [Thermoanaerobaculia bacterium]|jgi:hypothetical protein|nr:hypothetical protein [Thermoanaerobaculia bacterium]